MLKAKNISFYKILTAGYISAETYSALKPKSHFFELNSKEYVHYRGNILREIKDLVEDIFTYKALCGIEQMEASLFVNDNRPYKLLDTLLSSSDEVVKEFLLQVGPTFFLMDYVFCSKQTLGSRYFVTENNQDVIALFIEKYEVDFFRLYMEEEISNNEPMSYQEDNIANMQTDTSFVDTNPVTDLKTVNIPIIINIVPIDKDAISSNNIKYKKVVEILSRLTEQEFEPFRIFFERKLYTIPARTRNAINYIGYQNFYVNYLFADDVKLLSVRKLGRKSVYDFNKIRASIIDHIMRHIDQYHNGIEAIESVKEVQQEAQKGTLRDILGDTQYTILENYLHELTLNVSVRARNGIVNYYGDFLDDFVHKNKDVKSLQNIGKKTEEEVSTLILRLKEFVTKLKTVDEITPENLKIMQYKTKYGYCWDAFTQQYLIANGHLPMFHILENWLRSQKNREWNVLNSCCPLYINSERRPMEEVAREYNLSRERIRQLCTKAIDKLHSIDNVELTSTTVNYSKIISNKEDWKYIFECIQGRNILELSIMKTFLSEEKCTFSLQFGFLLLSLIVEKEYTLVGQANIGLPTRAKQKLSNAYLIKREYADAFRFCDIPDLLEKTEATLTKDTNVDAEQLTIDTFFSAWNNFDTDKVLIVSDILSHILIKECGKILNDDFQFTLKGKKVVNATEIIYETLSRNGNPMNLDDLFSKLQEVYPNKYKSSLSLKTLIANDPRICMVGTENLVALLEWSHIKVGSIRDIIVEYLSTFDEPVPISKIVEYVQKYRDTTDNSIRSTMSSGNQFVQFSGGLYGLRDKTYASFYNIPEKRRNFATRINDLEIFLRTNMRFPFNNSGNSREDSLYIWWRRILVSEDLNEDQKDEIKRIQKQYDGYPTTRRENEWTELYKKYKLFLQYHGRKPQRINSNEKILFCWFKKCMQDFSEGNMSPKQEKMYLELCNML